jgi:hypothetical protein
MSILRVARIEGSSKTNFEIKIPQSHKLITLGTLRTDKIQNLSGVDIWNPDPSGNVNLTTNITVSGTVFGNVESSNRLNIPTWTNSTRPTTNLVNGIIGYNTQENTIDVYSGGVWIQSTKALDGTSSDRAASSAAAILTVNPLATDGVYWINLPTVGPTQVYCAMGSGFAGGGGWMLAMKATQGTTFNYSSNYWTSTNTLNQTTELNRNNADMKNHVFNYFNASSFLAFFPDLNNGGQTSGAGTGWHWLQGGQSSTALNRFQNSQQLSGNPRGESMWVGSGFSAQGGFQWYGFNYTGNGSARTRWGFGWNNEGDQASNDVSGGIGMDGAYGSFSAGDRINCCQTTTGVNRAARFEIWVK